jgi:hypothetical protein
MKKADVKRRDPKKKNVSSPKAAMECVQGALVD